MLCYVRWPNGDHTLAHASDKEQLLDILDEQADPREDGVFIKQLGDKCRFAIDFTVKGQPLREPDEPAPQSAIDENTEFEVDAGAYESGLEVFYLAQEPASKLKPGKVFFDGTPDMVDHASAELRRRNDGPRHEVRRLKSKLKQPPGGDTE